MPAWGWVLIVIAIVVVVAAVAAAVAAWRARTRTTRLHQQFGPEYDRTVGVRDDRKEAEAELQQRLERRSKLQIRPLAPAARDRYLNDWRTMQAQFVDAPEAAVSGADALIVAVMRERGYPVDEFEQRAADVSVDHPLVVENYRAAHAIAERSARNEATTEDLRQAMQSYRALFDDLLETSGAEADAPLARERSADDAAVRDGAPTSTRNERKVAR
jgi:hypothetical protein